jgi:hypothetical protein
MPRMSPLTIQLDDAAARAVNGEKPPVRRVSPLHPGVMQPAPDFNAPLEELAPYV